jgi:glycine/D-amino acid oxidase-like deaminating enzyme
MNTGTPEADVIIVGVGVMGLSLAWGLVKRGRRVICIDKGAPGREASAATAGTLAIQNKPIGSIPLTLKSLALWAALDTELGRSVEYEVRGGVRVAHTAQDQEKLELSAAAQRAAGAPVETLTGAEIFSVAPYLSRQICAATFCRLDGMSNPFLAVRALFRACRAAGVGFLLDQAVTRVSVQADQTVRIQTGDFIALGGTAVIAAGAWIPAIAAGAGVHLPVTTTVQQVLITDFGAEKLPHVVTHVRGNLTLKQQSATGKVLIGGGWSGLGDPVSGQRRLSRDSVTGNARAALATVPGLASARLLRGWTGFEGRTPDKLPVIGPLPGTPTLHVLGCASGGLTLAPAAAELLAQRLCGEPVDLPLEPFSPARFVSPPDSVPV